MDQGSWKAIETGRALVIVNPCPVLDADRPAADFVAQLIACERRLPAYRNVRRADPVAAATAYQPDIPNHASAFQRVI